MEKGKLDGDKRGRNIREGDHEERKNRIKEGNKQNEEKCKIQYQELIEIKKEINKEKEKEEGKNKERIDDIREIREKINQRKKENKQEINTLNRGEEITEVKMYKEQKINKEITKIGFININGTNAASWPDLEEEFNDNELKIVGIVETHLRNKGKWNGKYFKMITKGREKKKKRGGGTAIMINNEKGWEFEEIEMEENEETEDIIACLIENKYLKIQQFLMIVCYMTTGNGEVIVNENKRKYKEIKKENNKC